MSLLAQHSCPFSAPAYLYPWVLARATHLSKVMVPEDANWSDGNEHYGRTCDEDTDWVKRECQYPRCIDWWGTILMGGRGQRVRVGC